MIPTYDIEDVARTALDESTDLIMAMGNTSGGVIQN